MARKWVTRGLSVTEPFDVPGRAAGLAIGNLARLATLRGRSAGAPAGPDVAPEWARVRRAGAGHDDPHGAARWGGGGEREVRSVPSMGPGGTGGRRPGNLAKLANLLATSFSNRHCARPAAIN